MSDEIFNPTDHTVAEVLAYVEGADPEERARVLSTERGGKSRARILRVDDRGVTHEVENNEAVNVEPEPFDATAEGTRAVDELIGDAQVLPRRRQFALAQHIADVAVAGKTVPISDAVKANLRIGEQ